MLLQRLICLLTISTLALFVLSCNKKKTDETNVPVPNLTKNPPPKFSMSSYGKLPLKKSGIGSLASLRDDLKGLDDQQLKNKYAIAYRLTFGTKLNKRNYKQARTLFQEVLKARPKFGPAYRGLGYTVFNIEFKFAKTIKLYQKAVALSPKHAESHYALAFMQASHIVMARRKGTPEVAKKAFQEGLKHLNIALKLGLKDERQLKKRFFGKLSGPVGKNPHMMNPHMKNPHMKNPHMKNPHMKNPHMKNPHVKTPTSKPVKVPSKKPTTKPSK